MNDSVSSYSEIGSLNLKKEKKVGYYKARLTNMMKNTVFN